jgi:signal transduction histidine kinase
MDDAVASFTGHNDCVTGRIGSLLGSLRRAEPRGAPPSGWALALDGVVAAGAAVGAVYEMTQRSQARTGTATVTVSGAAAAVQHAVQNGLPLSSVGHPLLTLVPAHPSMFILAVAALTALPLAWRRVYPITAWLVIISAIVIVQQDFVPKVALGTAVYAAYSAIAYSRYRNLAITLVSVTTVVAAAVFGYRLPEFQFPGRLTAIFVVLPAAAAGLGIRELRRRLADSTARLRRAAVEAAAATERALAAERARIAAELHDVVTHNVSVMIVQAGAARKILASSPPDAETALLAVEATGRDAMAELRNLLGLLSPAADGREAAAAGPRPGGEDRCAALLPQPGLGELDALIRRVSAAGLPVKLRVSGARRPMSQGADLAAYRVVQEGLTNVLRHAGRAAATVGVEWGDQLVITVRDDGPGTGPGDGNGAARAGSPGRGLLGLRERLALYGGELAAGPRPGGGWHVRAVMPTGTVS